MTLQQLVKKAETLFIENNKREHMRDIQLLLEHTMQCDRVYLLTHQQDQVNVDVEEQFMAYITMRIEGKPLQYIIGSWEFMGFNFKVTRDTLIPRRETEELVEFVQKHIEEYEWTKLLDVGTGTGCIPITLALLVKGLQCTAIDISKKALEVAKSNAYQHSVHESITWIESDLFSALGEEHYHKYDVITSNPPYIRSKDVDELMIEVKDFEPRLALDGGIDGLNFYRKITKEAPYFLAEGGYLVYEIGHDQCEEVMTLLKNEGYKDVGYLKDLSGVDRIVYGKFSKCHES